MVKKWKKWQNNAKMVKKGGKWKKCQHNAEMVEQTNKISK